MKEEPDNKDRITKTGNFPQGTTMQLGNSKNINGKGKRSHEKAVQ